MNLSDAAENYQREIERMRMVPVDAHDVDEVVADVKKARRVLELAWLENQLAQ